MSRHSFSNNIIIVVMSNLIIVALGIVIAFVLPKLIGSVESYGYWQLYYYYSGFYGLFLFGFNDGMNLLFAGKKYEELASSRFSAYFIYVLVSTSIVAVIMSLVAALLISNAIVRDITFFTLANIFILNITGFALHVNQISLRFKKYSRINMMERLLFALMLVPAWLLGTKTFILYIALNTGARIIVMLYGIYTIKDILRISEMKLDKICSYSGEIRNNIKVGLPLTFGTIFAMLIATSSRIVVERTQTIYNYGLFSLAFATLSLVVMMISALSTILYPSLKTINERHYQKLNSDIKFIITLLCMVALSVYFIIPSLVKIYLPKYASIEVYLYLLFPLIMYQSIGSIANDVFFRLARLERRIFLHNVLGFVVVVGAQFIVVALTKDISTMILSGLVSIALWAHLNDIYLQAEQGWEIKIISFLDLPIIAVFLFIAHNFAPYVGLFVYVVFSILVVCFFKKRIKDIITRLQNMGRSDVSK